MSRASSEFTTMNLSGTDAQAFYDLIHHPVMTQTEPYSAQILDMVEKHLGELSDTRKIWNIKIVVRDETGES